MYSSRPVYNMINVSEPSRWFYRPAVVITWTMTADKPRVYLPARPVQTAPWQRTDSDVDDSIIISSAEASSTATNISCPRVTTLPCSGVASILSQGMHGVRLHKIRQKSHKCPHKLHCEPKNRTLSRLSITFANTVRFD